MLVAGCRRAPGPPFARFASVEGRSPRVLIAEEETTVPLVVTNRGAGSWDPAHVHLSYHWLWLVPRELASRSRNVPYQDGIRTQIGRAIQPGRPVDANARLLAPSVPGLYWLQWDVVEEGVTWFSQVSPRQPRTLVVVLPAWSTVAGLVPLLIALAGAAAMVETARAPTAHLRRGAMEAPRVW